MESFKKKDNYEMSDLLKIMEKLISKDGCPWDKEQTHKSLRPYIIEESYEVAEAIDNEDSANLCEELGDVLFEVVFHSALAQKSGEFTFNDVVDGVSKKMVYRHPHVFEDDSAKDSSEVLVKWDELKKKEKGYKDKMDVIESVPKALPALTRTQKTVSKAVKNGLDTEGKDQSLKELKELVNRLDSLDGDNKCNNAESIIGEILLKTVKLSHFFEINSEFSLTNALKTYINRCRDFKNMQS